MSHLKLWFVSSSGIQLEKTEFYWDCEPKPTVSFRGNTSGAYYQAGNFRWTNAVKALSIFFLLSVLRQQKSHFLDDYQPTLVGKKGSIAHSLALAINKETCWLEEMFGSDYQGRVRIRKLVNISNMHLRFGSKVAVSLNQENLDPTNITIYFDNVIVRDPETLKNLIDSILPEFKSRTDYCHREDFGYIFKEESRQLSLLS